MKKNAAKEDNKITIEKIKKLAGKNKRMDWYQRWIRSISPYFTWIFLHLGLNANQVTLLSIIPVILGSSFLLNKDPLYWLVGWAIMQFYCIMDCSDGEVARYKNNLTKFGFVFDEFLHPIANVLVLTFAMFGLFYMYQNLYVFVLGVSSIVFILLNRLLKLSFSFRDNAVSQKTVGGGKVPLGGLIHVILVAALLDVFFSGFRLLFLVLIGAAAPLVFARNLIREYRFK